MTVGSVASKTTLSTNNEVGQASDDQPVAACSLEAIPNSTAQCWPTAAYIEVTPHLYYRAEQPERSNAA